MKALDGIVTVLLIVGGLNWGLVGLFDFNLVATIFGEASVLSRVVYTVVGVCALYDLLLWGQIRRRWRAGTPSAQPSG